VRCAQITPFGRQTALIGQLNRLGFGMAQAQPYGKSWRVLSGGFPLADAATGRTGRRSG
jgi:hypothetical protein